ncbi:uncharacterized protein N7479_001388 [Penicillium vulpinum]|uniref:Uncharacterized protein n=1 Tax=Penicillium vulpinum TaxID=29845 RepID=A0A1V6RU06_9EURO|nr:uncharacterized protein N7479_001388 [Penicillium vulpinum]KAJ5971470.1 hypothetical protein N7479_001388 [Penicillium vulpinum]OQE05265.1 hypothetical protein PENVUL_c026G00274 [Penicillium vulpinum]
MAESSVPGWEQYTSRNQITRSAASKIGHPDAAALTHLSRALYIPRHDGKTAHLDVHDMTTQYTAATGTLPIGCTQYAVAVGVMPKPRGDGTDDIHVSYNVDFNGLGDGEEVVGSVKFRAPSSSAEIELAISTTEDEAAVLTSGSPGATSISISTTYPISASSTRTGIVKHPYFTFKVPDGDNDPTTFQWQIHPSKHGRLRYTLVRNPVSQQEGSSSADIQAVYYHIGLDDSFSLPHSEGMLLLPPSQSSAGESIVVASTLGMLWRLRELHRGKGKVRKAGKTSANKFTRLFRKE